MAITNLNPRSWHTTGAWTDEPSPDALERLPVFGKRFFETLFAEFPELVAGTKFMQWSIQPGDIYAFIEWKSGEVGIQIDSDLDYIVVVGASGQVEYGDWGSDQVPPAVNHLREMIQGVI